MDIQSLFRNVQNNIYKKVEGKQSSVTEKKEDNIFDDIKKEKDNKNDSLYGDAISIGKKDTDIQQEISAVNVNLQSLFKSVQNNVNKKSLSDNGGNSSVEQKPVIKEEEKKNETKTETKVEDNKTENKIRNSDINQLLNNLFKKAQVNIDNKTTVEDKEEDDINKDNKNPFEEVKPINDEKPADDVKPTDETKPVEDVKPTDDVKLTDKTKPIEEVKEEKTNDETQNSDSLTQINKLLGTEFTNDNAEITTDTNNKITNIKQYNPVTKELENSINLYYDSSDNVALYIQNDTKADDGVVYNGIVNKDGKITYTPYSEEYLSQIDSYKYPALTQTLEAATVKIAKTISETDFTDFSLVENLTEDDAKYDLYQNESTVTIGDMQCKVFEYKSTMYTLLGETQETLYYKEIYDENWTKISELAELYDSNNSLISARSLVNYTENGIALTKQVECANANGELKSSTTVAWNPADEMTNKVGEGFTGLKPIKLFGDDDDPVDQVDKKTQKINELKEKLKVKKQQQTDLLDEITELREQIEELEDELFDLEIELSIAYCESFSDIARTARPYKEVLADVNAKEAEIDALKEQLDGLYDQYSSLNSEIDNLERQINGDYEDSRTAQDLLIEDFRQGELNDCTLLSELKKMGDLEDADIIKWNDDGSVDVKLFEVKSYDKNGTYDPITGEARNLEMGEQKTYHISAEDLAKDTVNINGNDYKISEGDLTVRAIERAALQQIDYSKNQPIYLAKALLTGKPEYTYNAGNYKAENLENANIGHLLKKDNSNDEYYSKALGQTTDSSGDLVLKDVNGNYVKVEGNHEYTINYNKNTDWVTVTDPHDTAFKDMTFDSDTFSKAFSIGTSEQQNTTKTLWDNISDGLKAIAEPYKEYFSD